MVGILGTTASTLSVLTVVLLFASHGEAQGARLPQFLCDIYRDTFVNLGCVDRENLFCRILVGLMTDTLFGRPACDYFPCRLYGRSFGTCLRARNCAASVRNGICNRGSVCCTKRKDQGGSSSRSSGSSSSRSFALDNTDVAALGTFAVDDLPIDFQDTIANTDTNTNANTNTNNEGEKK